MGEDQVNLDCCPSCCSTCNARIPAQVAEDPRYASTNMLPAGTIELMVATLQFCDHLHADDGWHQFRGDLMLPHLANSTESSICDELDYLIKHRYILASYRHHVSADLMYIRIYIIPYDLPNVDGKLLLRPENVAKPARLYLKRLLPTIDKTLSKWEGYSDILVSPTSPSEPFFFSNVDNRTMAEIYSDLPSPKIILPRKSKIGCIAHQILSGDGPDGLVSPLYEYQRRTVVAMLQRELPKERIGLSESEHLTDVLDPLYVSISGINGKEYHLQPAKMTILRDRPKVTAARGGILCEELGTGKTVMILALILATLTDLPIPESSIYQRHPPRIMTPLSFRHFPSDFENERKRVLTGKNRHLFSEDSRLPSLVELLLHHLRVPQHGFQPIVLQQYQDELEPRKLYAPLMANTPFYHYDASVETIDDDRPKRRRSKLPPRVMFITNATLIVVPNSLMGQWNSEVNKHCSPLIRVLSLRRTTPMPPAQELASNYDIILMTSHRFSSEASLKDKAKLHSRPICSCPALETSRIPDCKCPVTPGVSPLLQIRWKRLVVDEGHVSASLSTNMTPFAQLLSVERRWIVSGTPTTNLLGLTFGQSSEVEVKDEEELEYEPETEGDLESRSETDQTVAVARKWTRYDREDLRKLDNMATHFIGVPHFRAEPGVFANNVTAALFGTHGFPQPGAIQVLEQVMQLVMLRHRTEDVERDIILPSIRQETILLDLDPYVAKSYNALQANIAINAIDSERRDIDYLFHPRNVDSLRSVVENISQLMFWFTDSSMFNVVEMNQHAAKTLTKAMERNVSGDDLKLLQDAQMHIRIAVEDPMWRAIQAYVDIPYQVFHMPPSVLNGWTRIPLADYPLRSFSLTGVMHPDRLLKIRDLVTHRPLISEERVIEWGLMVEEQDRKERLLVEEEEEYKRLKKKQKPESRDINNQLKAVEWAKRGARAEMIQEIRAELAKVLKKMEDFNGTSPPRVEHVERDRTYVLPPSILSPVRVGTSCSSKLNYILNEVLQYGATEKFLIFSNSPLTLSHVAQGLDLIRVKYLQFTTQVTPQLREQFVTTFETSDTYRIFLMELKHGARGLNLVSASRVIFCEPVWQADVESQAIKRVHRIGQQKPVTVKTLAIRFTAEEAMMTRREMLKNNDGRLPRMTEEVGMRHFIANPRFITDAPLHLPTLDIPLICHQMDAHAVMEEEHVSVFPEDRSSTSSSSRTPTESVVHETAEPPRKKMKTSSVRFAD